MHLLWNYWLIHDVVKFSSWCLSEGNTAHNYTHSASELVDPLGDRIHSPCEINNPTVSILPLGWYIYITMRLSERSEPNKAPNSLWYTSSL